MAARPHRCAGHSIAGHADGAHAVVDADMMIDDEDDTFEKDGGDEPAADFFWIYPIGIGQKNYRTMMLPSDLKMTLIGDGGDEVRSARGRMRPLMPTAVVLVGLRSRRICDHIVVTNRMDDSNHPSHASLVVGSPKMGEMLLLSSG
ncbi:hypothetical protein ACLOJK_027725 [Asimina triloba]